METLAESVPPTPPDRTGHADHTGSAPLPDPTGQDPPRKPQQSTDQTTTLPDFETSTHLNGESIEPRPRTHPESSWSTTSSPPLHSPDPSPGSIINLEISSRIEASNRHRATTQKYRSKTSLHLPRQLKPTVLLNKEPRRLQKPNVHHKEVRRRRQYNYSKK
ncbi:hypothetical protein Rs2_06707 [Raphanus sativus]|nr:hypothetical protein Rs2_06707 [Raphanus sativus]